MESAEICLDPLPNGFMMSKPVNSVTDERIENLERAGRLRITRKQDGYRIWAVKAERVKLYTRGLQEVTKFFPDIVELLEQILPSQTFIDGEMVVNTSGRDNFSAIQRIFAHIFKEDDLAAVQKLQEDIGYASYMIFGVIFWGGEKYVSRPWRDQYEKILQIFKGKSFSQLTPVQILDCSFEEAQELVVKQRWEGLVLYDSDGCSDYRLDGKVGRPQVCWKRKPIAEDDFIVRRWIARPKDPSMVRDLVLSQINPITGEEIDCGKCGIGLSNAKRAELADDSLYPLVVEVKYFERFSSGKLRSASFLRVREDKRIEECIFSKDEKADE